jgi:hypothetical protein
MLHAEAICGIWDSVAKFSGSADWNLAKNKRKNDAQHRVIKTPAHRSAWQFKIPNNPRKTKYAIF